MLYSLFKQRFDVRFSLFAATIAHIHASSRRLHLLWDLGLSFANLRGRVPHPRSCCCYIFVKQSHNRKREKQWSISSRKGRRKSPRVKGQMGCYSITFSFNVDDGNVEKAKFEGRDEEKPNVHIKAWFITDATGRQSFISDLSVHQVTSRSEQNLTFSLENNLNFRRLQGHHSGSRDRKFSFSLNRIISLFQQHDVSGVSRNS